MRTKSRKSGLYYAFSTISNEIAAVAERTERMKNLAEITAHSSCEGTPVDSLESVETAIRLGADTAEIDVRKSASGLVISHDRREEAQYVRCVTLDQAFAAIAPHASMKVNCDIKEADILTDVLALASKYALDRDQLVISGSVYPPRLARDPSLADRAQIALNIEQVLAEFLIDGLSPEQKTEEYVSRVRETPWDFLRAAAGDFDAYLKRAAELCLSLGVAALNVPHVLLTRERLETFRALCLPVSVWTVNDAAMMRELIEGGVANLTTLRVREALAIRTEVRERGDIMR
jgi:glycerophosphoryl diester phosphodiesterase